MQGPGTGVGFLRVIAVLEAGAPEVDVAGGPVIAVGGVLAHDDPQSGLAGGERAGDFEALPGGCRRHLRWPGQVGSVGVVDDGQRDLARAGGSAGPDVKGVGPAVGKAGDLLLDDGRGCDGGDHIRRLVAVRAMNAFELTEQEPPFLSQVAEAKSSECFAMFSSGPPMVWWGPQSTGPVKWSPARLSGM